MKKIIFYTLLIFGILIPQLSQAETLNGSIEKDWSVDSARTEAFRQAKPWVDLSKYPPIDPNLIGNKILISKNQLDSNERHITLFSDGGYSVRYDNAITKGYFYNDEGKLQEVDFTFFTKNIYTKDDMNKYSDDELYPAKSYKHEYPSGKIIGIGFYINGSETYIFRPSGELHVHWIGPKCYDAKGNMVLTRDIEKE